MMENHETDPRQRLRPNRSDPLHDQQLHRNVQAINEQTTRALGPLPPGGLPVQQKHKPNLPKPMQPATEAITMLSCNYPSDTLPDGLQCPIPDDLKETLKSYPEYLARLQNELNRFVNEYPLGGYDGSPLVSSRYAMTRKEFIGILCGFFPEVSKEVRAAWNDASEIERDKLSKKLNMFFGLTYYYEYGEFSSVSDFLAANGK